MSRIRADKFVNSGANGAPQLTFGAEVVAGVGLTGAGGINITGVATATTFSGALSGNATSATTATTATNAQGLTGTPDIVVRNIIGVGATLSGVLTYEDVTNIDSLGIVTARTGIKVLAGGINAVGVVTATQGVSDSIGPLRRLGSNIKTSNYTLVAADAGKMVRVDNGSTITVPDNVFTTGDMITIVSGSSSNVPITEGTNVTLYNASDGTDGSVTLAARTVCTILVASGGSSSKIYIAGGGIS